MNTEIIQKAIGLLKQLIGTSSFSREEDGTALIIEQWLSEQNIKTNRSGNNIWAINQYFDAGKPSILLNSHHDTVKPNKAYTNDPFEAREANGKLYGLGSNDAGGALVSLITLFVHLYHRKEMKYNIVLAATAEEEISGKNGIASIMSLIPPIDFAVIGEPTQMKLAIAEKGLMVIDAYADGISGHAAHENTENAIYNAMKDIDWIKSFSFDKTSQSLGVVKMSVTQISAGSQHNVVPASCHFVIDVRVNDEYDNKEVYDIIDRHTSCRLQARSFRLSSSSIAMDHPIVKAGIALDRETYGSQTISDQALLSCPSLKLGPGVSARSHSANEYIELAEIEEGINLYIELFNKIL